MDRFRQFVHPEQGSLVMCHWDADHGHWVCDSDRDGRFHQCVPTMTEVVSELREEGYEEHP